jgi:hypothetical protein
MDFAVPASIRQAGPRIQSHVTGAGIGKREDYRPRHLLSVLINLVSMDVRTIHDRIQRPLPSWCQAGHTLLIDNESKEY